MCGHGDQRSSLWARGLLVLALLAAIGVPLLGTDAPQDDAYITYRYAQNLVAGDGLVFNAGEQPVEGYTNFLWTVLIAGGMAAGLDPEFLGPALGLLFTLITVLLCARLAARLGARPAFAAAAALLLAVQPTQMVHAIGGLETSMFSALVLAGLLPRVRARRTARGEVASSLFLAAAALTRPEGVLLFGLLELGDAVAARVDRVGVGAWLRGALRRALPFGLIVGLHLAWRVSFYGEWVPNTFHSKVASSSIILMEGMRYVGEAALSFGLPFMLVPYLLVARRPGRRARLVCLWLSTVYLLYVARVGGDYMPTFRFLLPVFPLWSALACSSFSVAGEGRGSSSGLLRAGVVLAILGLAGTGWAYTRAGFWPGQDERQADLVAAGKTLDRILPADAWIAATAAGRVPYFARRRCIDMMGLSDSHIARVEAQPEFTGVLEGHLKGDGGYVLDREPEVIVFLRLVALPEPLAAKKRWLKEARRLAFSISENQIAGDPRLVREYRLYSLPLLEREGVYLNVFARPGTFPAAGQEGAIPGLIQAASPR